jgi:N-acetylneuraminic acid mutarotase
MRGWASGVLSALLIFPWAPILESHKLRSWRRVDFDTGFQRPLKTSAPGFVALDGKLYQFGGNTDEGREAARRISQLDPQSDPAWILLDAKTVGVVGNPPQARSRFDITALQGCVYVFGGWTPSGYANDLHQFDTRALVWRHLDPLTSGEPPSPRYFFGITASDTAMYVFGGMTNTGVPTNDLFQFEPQSLTWRTLTASGDIPSPRYSHAFAYKAGALYSFSGKDSIGMLDEFFRFDLNVMEWTRISSGVPGVHPVPRIDAKLAVLGETLFLFGGKTTSGYSNELFRFDEFHNQSRWSDLTLFACEQQPEGRSRHGLAPLKGSLYVFGGISAHGRLNDVFRHDVRDQRWRRMDRVQELSGAVPTARYGNALADMGSKLYMFGGNTTDGASNVLAVYDRETHIWTSINASDSAPSARFAHGLVQLSPFLIVFGGETHQGFSNELFTFNPEENRWRALGVQAGAPSPRSRFGICVDSAHVFVFGGLTASGPSNHLYVWDSLSWIRVNATSPPTPRYSSGLTIVNSDVYTFGGVTLLGFSRDLFRCTFVQERQACTWQHLDAAAGVQGQVNQATAGHALVSSAGSIFLFGGYRDTQSLNADSSQGMLF